MGLVGGPHCLAMCAAPCHAVIQGHGKAVQMHATLPQPAAWPVWSATQFHAGRLLGYGVLGAVAAFAMEQVAWFSDRTSMLHPVWVMMHLAILAWGLLMLFQGSSRCGWSVPGAWPGARSSLYWPCEAVWCWRGCAGP